MTKVFAPNEWTRRSFSKNDYVMSPPSLMKLQISSYEDFLQKDIPPAKREEKGLQHVFKQRFWTGAQLMLKFLTCVTSP